MWVGGMMGEKRDTSCSLPPPPDLYRPRGAVGERKSIIIPPPPPLSFLSRALKGGGVVLATRRDSPTVEGEVSF